MKKNIIIAFALFFLGSLILLATPQASFAAAPCPNLTAEPYVVEMNYKGTITITSKDVPCFAAVSDDKFVINKADEDGNNGIGTRFGFTKINDTTLEFKNFKEGIRWIGSDTEFIRFNKDEEWVIYLCVGMGDQSDSECNPQKTDFYLGSFTLNVGGDKKPDDYDLPILDRNAQDKCFYPTDSNDVSLKVTGLEVGQRYHWWLAGASDRHTTVIQNANPAGITELTFNLGGQNAFSTTGSKKICVDRVNEPDKRHETPTSLTPTNCIALSFSKVPWADSSCQGSAPVVDPVPPPCSKYEEVGGDSDKQNGGCLEVNSAIGPLLTEPGTFIPKFLAIFLSLSGGIALLLIIRSGYQLLTSQGDAEKVKEARERITSAIIGILFMIFSLVILQTIGVDILHIPGFAK